MKNLFLHATALAVLAFASSVAPAAQLLFEFAGTNLSVFDVSGTYVTNTSETHEEYTISHSPQGKLTAPFTATYDDGAVQLSMSGTMRGRVAASENNFRMTLGGRATFSGLAYGRPVSGTAFFNSLLRPDAAREQLVGRQTVTVCVPRRGCQRRHQDIAFHISDSEPPDRGDWTLSLDVTNTNNRITGVATATLANGRTVPFKVSGFHAVRTGVNRLRLSGTGEAKGVTLVVTTDADLRLLKLNGRLFGQRVIFP